MIFIDNKGHMVTDEMTSELHKFAAQIGLEMTWYRNRFIGNHYKLNPKLINKAINLGAHKVRDSKILSYIYKGEDLQLCSLCSNWDSKNNFINTSTDGIICRKCYQEKENAA